MRFESRFDIYTLFMILGVFQGFFLSYFYLSKKNRKHAPNFFWGLLLLTISIIGSEIILNYTGLIVKVIRIENYSEPFVFLIPPLMYGIIKTSLKENYKKEDWIHFLPFGIYFTYCFLYFLQSPEFKYNSFVYCYHPNWNYLEVNLVIPDDPLGLRNSLEQLYISQFLIYAVLIYQKLNKNIQGNIFNFRLNNRENQRLVISLIIYGIFFILILFIKIYFDRDLGDYIIGSCFAIPIYLTSFVIMRSSLVLSETSVNNRNGIKYEKSSLSDTRKDEILNKLILLLEKEKIYIKNTVSLATVSKALNEQPHHVSQTINEKLNKNFFEIIADYRINEAKKLLKSKESINLTIEEIAENIGYNSKSAFNKIFKKITGITPSEFRNTKQL